jgi:hypothetical protein
MSITLLLSQRGRLTCSVEKEL